MKLYTGFGDQGKTSLWGGEVVLKNDPRVTAYGTLDELNSIVGLIRSINDVAEIDVVLQNRQNEIFNLSSEIAASSNKQEVNLPDKISSEQIQALESEMDIWIKQLPLLKKFILPGGGKSAAYAHFARTICRRAEREMVTFAQNGKLRDICLIYINRLSDWLFVLGRYLNHIHNIDDLAWDL